MLIEQDRAVAFHYLLRDASGKELENSATRGQPQWYLHGHGQIVPGLEAELAGKQAGDRFSAMVPAQAAYGLRNESDLMRVPLKRLKDVKPLKVGNLISLKMPDGSGRVATVLKIGMTVVDLDINHPLAGQALGFEVEVLEVRAASAEELQHGHVHTPGMAAH